MDFLWDKNNEQHISNHGVSRALAERVFWSGLDDLRGTSIAHRYLIEAEVDGRTYRLICDVSASESVYPVTCFPL